MSGWPITKYGISQLKKYTIVFFSALLAVFIVGNIIGAVFSERIKVDTESWIKKDGFAIFTSNQAYISLIRSYPYDFGTELKIHKMSKGESFWDVATRNRVTIDTIIGANPFLDSLIASEGIEIVIPAEDGLLFAFNSIIDVWRMSRLLEYEDDIKGDFLPSVFRFFSPDDIRFAFFKNSKPEIVNNSIEKIYTTRKLFMKPVIGYFTSMYGQRIDPFIGKKVFHNGIDIRTKYGTPIYASREGFVSSAGWMGQLGRTVTIIHRDGYETMYGHLGTINVKQGDWVTKDDAIGTLGSTGRSTGPHLHFTIKRHGNHLNPLLFIW